MAAAAMVVGAAAPAAHANIPVGQPGHIEVGSSTPGQLAVQQVGDSAGRGGATTQSSPFWRYVCNTSWVPVQSYPNGYVTGNCGYNETIEATQYDSAVTFAGGLISGSYGGCSWINLGGLTFANASGYTGNCPPGSNSLSDSAFISGSNVWTHWVTSSSADGVTTSPAGYIGNKNCQEWANFHPWASGQAPTNPTVAPAATGGPRLALRYYARYADPNTGYGYAMVHDNYVSPGAGNWNFIQQACLTNVPAPGTY
jgi:hypothetical protein